MSFLKKVLEVIAPKLIPESSDGLRAMITASLDEWEAKAEQTKNPFDDILVKVVRKALGL